MTGTEESATAAESWRCPKCGATNPGGGLVGRCRGCGAPRPADFVPIGLGPPPGARVVVPRERGRSLLLATWAYGALVIAALGLIHLAGDGWWPVTLLLFMPRWLLLAPVAVLAVASLLSRCRWHLILQAAVAAVVAGPLMGVNLPVQQAWERRPEGDRLRVVTFNLGSEPIDLAEFLRWLERNTVDVVCLQEGGPEDPACLALRGAGWTLSRKSRLATRLPVAAEFPEYPYEWRDGGLYTSDMERLRVRVRSGCEVVCASVHLPTVREGISAFLQTGGGAAITRHNAWWGHEMARILSTLAGSSDVPVVIAGDFNMPADDSTMAALRSSFRFAFEEAGWGYGYTRPTGTPWVRIDHILAGPQWHVAACLVGPDLGSDHLPVIAELVLPAEPPPAR